MIRPIFALQLVLPSNLWSHGVLVRHKSTVLKRRWPRGPVWPEGFVDPIAHKDEIETAKEDGNFKRKTLVPVKAAQKDATCSLFLNPETLKFIRRFTTHGTNYIVMEQLKETFGIIKEIQLKRYYKASEANREHIIVDPQDILKRAIENAKPLMSIQKVKVGGMIYSVPAPITEFRSEYEATRWIAQAAKDRDTRNTRLPPTLANILIDAANNTGRVIAVKNEHHKVCEANRAYAHFRKTV